jgi:putative Mg2+ transporter-C (MgtC) family protein
MESLKNFFTSLADHPEYFQEINNFSIVLRTILSVSIGGLIGLERGKKNRPAGFRTYMLVCFGATVVMMTNQYIFQTYHTSDPARLGAQVISGIGFLGAGSIMVTGHNQIKGITTAAGLWASACIGLAIGIGFYTGAIVGGFIIYVIMAVMGRIDTQIRENSRLIVVYLEFSKKQPLSEFLSFAHEHQLDVSDIQMTKNKFLKDNALCATMVIKTLANHTRTEILDIIKNAEGVQFFEEI